VSIQASYVSQLGTTVTLPSSPWVLNVNECTPAFTISVPASPVDYTISSAST